MCTSMRMYGYRQHILAHRTHICLLIEILLAVQSQAGRNVLGCVECMCTTMFCIDSCTYTHSHIHIHMCALTHTWLYTTMLPYVCVFL